jgi:hypothetical protein
MLRVNTHVHMIYHFGHAFGARLFERGVSPSVTPSVPCVAADWRAFRVESSMLVRPRGLPD